MFQQGIVEKSRLDQLTGLRYLAALFVFFSHLNWQGAPEVLQSFFSQGYVGVSFFFMLSGFVLAYSYADKIRNHGVSFKRYYLLRIARLSPLHLGTALPFVLLAVYAGRFDWNQTLLNLSFLHSWVPDSAVYFSLNSPSWSLSNEMFFYLAFFPLVMLSSRQLTTLIVLLLLIVMSSATFVYLRIPGLTLTNGTVLSHWLFYIFPAFRLLEFLVGMWIYQHWSAGNRIGIHWQWIGAVALISSMAIAEIVPEPFRYSLFYLPVILLVFLSQLATNGLCYRVFSSRTLVLLGNASFAFYLIHQPLIRLFDRLLNPLAFSVYMNAALILLLVSSLSVVVYLVYEKPAEAWFKKKIAS